MPITNKEELEFLVARYQQVFVQADPGLIPQGHRVVLGRAFDKRRALEMAYLFMNAAVNLYDKNREEAMEYYYIARGLAISQGEIPTEGGIIPEPTVTYKPGKPS